MQVTPIAQLRTTNDYYDCRLLLLLLLLRLLRLLLLPLLLLLLRPPVPSRSQHPTQNKTEVSAAFRAGPRDPPVNGPAIAIPYGFATENTEGEEGTPHKPTNN